MHLQNDAGIYFGVVVFFLEFSFSHHTYTSYMVTITVIASYFSFNLMAIVCVIANLKMPFRKFPNLRVYQANFPNLKGPRAPSQNCQKNPWCVFILRKALSIKSFWMD